jgi:hypothetical protein
MSKPSRKTRTLKTRAAEVVPLDALPYETSFREVLSLIQRARQRAFQAVNMELIDLYWSVGEYISRRIASDGWGKSTIVSLADYIRRHAPDPRGFSAQNLWRMRQFHEAYRGKPKLSALLRELPWTHSSGGLDRIVGEGFRRHGGDVILRFACCPWGVHPVNCGMAVNGYTALVKQSGDWWIGWVQEVPGVNAQERTKEELLLSLRQALREAIEIP